MKKGFDVLRDKTLNRSITFSRADRRRLGLRGLLPHRVTIAADGKPVEEWTIEKLKVNPSVKADLFDKK